MSVEAERQTQALKTAMLQSMSQRVSESNEVTVFSSTAQQNNRRKNEVAEGITAFHNELLEQSQVPEQNLSWMAEQEDDSEDDEDRLVTQFAKNKI